MASDSTTTHDRPASPRPRSLRSVSPSSSSRSSSPPPALDPNTLALLNSFYSERAEAEEKFKKMEQAAHKRLVKAQQQSGQRTEHDLAADALADDDDDDDDDVQEMISVDEFREMFGEDWQLSQFWYSTSFAARLSAFVASLVTPAPPPAAENSSSTATSPTTAFLCCPTGYVSFTSLHPPHLRSTRLLEYDRRFGLFAGKRGYVPYDIDEPDDVPSELVGKIELAIADPPFLNEVTNRKLARTLRKILHPTRGRLVLLTSTSVEHLFPAIYDSAPLGPLRKLDGFKVEHAGGIANDFGVWTSWQLSDEERRAAFG